MAIPRMIAGKISDPRYSVLQQLSQLTFPGGFQLAAPGDPEASTGAYGTVIPARRNFKPFVVGLIPPDVPADFVAFRRAGGEQTAINALPRSVNPSKNRVTDRSLTNRPRPSSNDGEIARTRQNAPIGDVRKAIYDSYTRYVGTPPTDAQINLIAAHMAKERGIAGGSIPTWNYNFGNQIAVGEKRGTYQPPYNTLAGRKAAGLGVEGSPEQGLDTPPGKPKGGTYYFSTEYDGQNNAYPGYYQGFTNLQQGVDNHVWLLAKSYPGAATATTPEEYTDGLLNGTSGQKWFEASPQVYLDGMNRNYSQISTAVNNGQYGGQLGGTVRPPDPSISNGDNPSGNDRFIMSQGSVTNLQSDPAGDRIGKFVEFDPEREQLVQAQVSALQAEIEAIAAIPGLLLLVNPSDFDRSYQASVDNSVKGRQKNIVHVWLERPAALSASGVTSGQYVVSPDGNGGITNQLRVFSASYQNLLSLLTIYKTNGIIYSGPEIKGDPRIRQLGYSVFIYYDNHIYIGSFDSFEIQDSELKPHNMSYSFKFNVRYDLDVGNDGRFTDFEIGVNNGFFPTALPAV